MTPGPQKFKLGVPIRDMRLLDPNLLTSETGKVLVRDNAIVFSMEHARLLITADCGHHPAVRLRPLAARAALCHAAGGAHRRGRAGGAGGSPLGSGPVDKQFGGFLRKGAA